MSTATTRLHREQLQPALLDRLIDDVTSFLGEISTKHRLLAERLDAPMLAYLDELLSNPNLPTRPLRPSELQAFSSLDDETMAVVLRVIELEQARRAEQRQTIAISMDRLRASVLRELGHLLNTESPQNLQEETEEGSVELFSGFPQAKTSVLNYGIPPLAGRIRTPSDYVELARDIEKAIQVFEPRLNSVKVTYEGVEDGALSVLRSPVALIIDAELWGHPMPEPLRIRTVLDLEDGEARIEEAQATEMS
jgi:type VI secretion system protein ImpF